jgi:DNA-binding beta-propeller fold protein YncE
MNRHIILFPFLLLFILLFFSCQKDEAIIDTGNYPRDIGKILVGKCATSGCHNNSSYQAASGLNLSTWSNLLNGGNSGAVVIPFSSEMSSLMYFINTYSDLGLTNTPTMPLNKDKLSREEVLLLKNWINSGAPDEKGNVAFPSSANRSKFYVAHTSCKIVCVFDALTQLQMRYVKVVNENENCTAHQVKVSPDGKYWYVCYTNNGKYLRKYSTYDDSFVGEIFIGTADWNTFSFTPDSKKAFVVDWSSSGKVAECDLENMRVIDTTRYNFYPHGSAVSTNGQFLYFTATTGNFIYKKNLTNGNIDFIPLSNNDVPGLPSSIYNPHEILFSEDGLKYYVSCQNEKTIRVFNSQTDECIAVIPINGSTLEMSLSPTTNLLFVTSWDSNQFTETVGAVAVINTNTNSLIKYINSGTEPHGIAVDEKNKKVYVANRNINSSGPLPHHTSICGGRNGYVSFIDLTSLELVGKRIELSVDPYSISIKR